MTNPVPAKPDPTSGKAGCASWLYTKLSVRRGSVPQDKGVAQNHGSDLGTPHARERLAPALPVESIDGTGLSRIHVPVVRARREG